MAIVPEELIRATVLYVNDHNPLPMKRAVDRLVTTPFGYLTLVQAGYRGPEGTWDVGALADDLAEGTARVYQKSADDPAIVPRAKVVAERAIAIARALELPGGPPREARLKDLAPIERGRPPLRPINVEASKHQQHDLELDVDGPVRVRFIDVAEPGYKHVVLLIHGHASRLEEYEKLVAKLLETACRVIVCDLPGCGYSDHPERDYRLGWYERVLLALLDARKVTAKCVVAGGSLGGNLSLRLGLRAPDRFSHIVSWAPAGWWKTDAGLATGARLLKEQSFWSAYRIQAQSWYAKTNDAREALIDGAIEYAHEVFSTGFLRAYRDVAWEQTAKTMFPHADEIRVPTLLLVAKGDTSLDMHNGVIQLKKQIPGAELHEYEGAHSIAEEHTDDLAKRLLAFVGG